MLTVLCGDAIEQLRTLPDESVQCCVTSPPYWGLRDYGTAAWEGGMEICNHEPTQEWIDHNFNANSAFGNGTVTQSAAAKGRWYKGDGGCPRCGAKRIDSQLGLEKTPEEYVAKMVEVFREVRRVLRKDGTLWLNLGDSYARCGGEGNGKTARVGATKMGVQMRNCSGVDGLKEKDLVGIPWRVAFALQADGWWLRSDIIWAKPNGMPESTLDRPTRAHEYVFQLSKSQRYFYDYEAVRLPPLPSTISRLEQHVEAQVGSVRANGGEKTNGTMKAVRRTDKQRGHSRRHDGFNDRWDAMEKEDQQANGAALRSVWWISPAQYAEAHFAVMPRNLAALCILAGSRIGDTILDPFAGSGTTGMVALELGRKAILIELNRKYVELIEQRCNVTMGLALA